MLCIKIWYTQLHSRNHGACRICVLHALPIRYNAETVNVNFLRYSVKSDSIKDGSLDKQSFTVRKMSPHY